MINIEEIKRHIMYSELDYSEDAVYSIQDIDDVVVEYKSEEILDVRRWETDTLNVYKISSQDGQEYIYIGVVDTTGNTEIQPNEGITDVYEVEPKVISKTRYTKVINGEL